MSMQNIGGIMRDLDKEQRDYAARWAIIHQCADHICHERIMATCARHELESDEFLTREEKATQLIHQKGQVTR